MDAKSSSIKSATVIALIYGILSLASFSTIHAERGCCSKHGGVAGCNVSTGYLKCKDGTQSPSCKCSGEKKKQTKTKATYESTSPKPILPPIFSPKKTDEAKKPTSTRGCCKGHGGVSGCDSKTGYQKCKDGTLSPSCRC